MRAALVLGHAEFETEVNIISAILAPEHHHQIGFVIPDIAGVQVFVSTTRA